MDTKKSQMKNFHIIKNKAKWLPSISKLCLQYLISFISYCTLPFFIPKDDAIKDFFKKNYYIKCDNFIFDGHTNGYYSQLDIITKSQFDDKRIIDIGCGQCGLYHWLNQNGIKYKQYIGIDFAMEECQLSSNDFLYNKSVYEFFRSENYLNEKTENIYFMVNSICYLSDKELNCLFEKIDTKDKVVIIDPNPNLFWDAHFSGVRPIYRNINNMISILTKYNIEIIQSSVDYHWKFEKKYMDALSYMIFASKRELNDG